jgi:hypothetical protein
MSMRTLLSGLAGSLVLSLASFGCGGTSAGVGGNGGDGGPPDGSALDGPSTAESGSDTGPMYDAPSSFDVVPLETGTVEGGGDAGSACTGTGATCTTCCRTNNPEGYKTIVTAALMCACKPSICGPVDAGVVSDASDIGVGACATTCAGTAMPDATCDKCLTDATGSMGDPGACYGPVSTACEADPNCVAYYTCLSGCM